jgi:hypothetical protein
MQTSSERQNWEAFTGVVLADPGLHEQLRAAASEAAFADLAVRLGAEHGCGFTAATVTAVIREERRAWFERWI